jgi:hypothetical protein
MVDLEAVLVLILR